MSGSRSRSFVVVSGSELSHRPESEVSEVDVRMGTDVKETVVMCILHHCFGGFTMPAANSCVLFSQAV